MTFPYDTLIVAGGLGYSYFGHDEWKFAAEVKSLESANAVRHASWRRSKPLSSSRTQRREAWLTFVVRGLDKGNLATIDGLGRSRT